MNPLKDTQKFIKALQTIVEHRYQYQFWVSNGNLNPDHAKTVDLGEVMYNGVKHPKQLKWRSSEHFSCLLNELVSKHVKFVFGFDYYKFDSVFACYTEETREEAITRLKLQEKAANAEESRERALLANLKAKYEQ
jgi:hypothetical protein